MIEVTVNQLFLSNMGFVVLLKGDTDERALPIFIGAAEAQAIAIWMNRVKIPRPLTHDLIKNLLHSMGCRLDRIEVCELKEGTFYARLVLMQSGGELVMDSRPSDAIALALRCSAPIFVDEAVMNEAGRVFTEEELKAAQQSAGQAQQATPKNKPRAKPPRKQLSPLEILKRDLEKAVSEERYEDAAKLRDEINGLEQSHSPN
jgi:bifunctional DNase/RNase